MLDFHIPIYVTSCIINTDLIIKNFAPKKAGIPLQLKWQTVSV